MNIKNAENTILEFSDVTAWANDGQKLLVSKVRARSLIEDLYTKVKNILIFEQEQNHHVVPFAMTVTPKEIHFYEWNDRKLNELFKFSTPEILSIYDSEFEEKRIFESYLEILVESWLRDLAWNWKTDNPPKYQELQEIGFIEKLVDATQEDIET